MKDFAAQRGHYAGWGEPKRRDLYSRLLAHIGGSRSSRILARSTTVRHQILIRIRRQRSASIVPVAHFLFSDLPVWSLYSSPLFFSHCFVSASMCSCEYLI